MLGSLACGTRLLKETPAGRKALRSALIKGGEKLVGKEAHHLIPTQLLTENKLVADAVNAGFDFNGKINGIGLTKVVEDGVHANHPAYTRQIAAKINSFADANKNYTGAEAKEFLEDFAGQLKSQVQKGSVQGGKKVN